MLSEAEVREIILEVLERDIDESKKIREVVKERQKEIKDRIGDFDRNAYRKLLNGEIREAFYRLVDGKETSADINMLKTVEFGTKQWSDDSYNIMKIGNFCSNCCLYCYVSTIYNTYGQADVAAFFKKYIEKGVQIIGEGKIKGIYRQAYRVHFETDNVKASKNWGKRGKRKLWMSPTSHDIFPENMEAMVAAWKRMIKVGHKVLIVSKPRMECIKYICDELKGYKDSVTFRFTITSDIKEILDVFEPIAPRFDERLACLEHAYEMGFETSISVEPFLSDPVPNVEKLLPFVTGEIWIGAMNGFPSEKIIGHKFTKRENDQIDRLKNEEYTFENHARIVNALRGNPKIQWKESFIKLYLKERGDVTRYLDYHRR